VSLISWLPLSMTQSIVSIECTPIVKFFFSLTQNHATVAQSEAWQMVITATVIAPTTKKSAPNKTSEMQSQKKQKQRALLYSMSKQKESEAEMSKEKQIVEIARVLNECCNEYDEIGRRLRNKCFSCEHWSDTNHCCCSYGIKEATTLYEEGYRKASDIVDEVIKRLLDAFPEGNRDNKCPAIYYDDYRTVFEIINKT